MSEITKDTLKNYLTIEEIRQTFNLAQLVELTKNNMLQEWLEDRLYYDQASALNPDNTYVLNGDELRLLICEVLEIDIMNLSEHDARALERALERRRKKMVFIRADNGDPDGAFVENQHDLMEVLLKSHYSTIYLCSGQFQIPLDKKDITYIGRDNAVVDITSRKTISFDSQNIRLKDLTLFLHYITEEQVEVHNSENLKFIIGNEVALNPDLWQEEIYSFIQGRNSFETFDEFAQRSEKMQGIVVGDVLLDSKDFDITNNVFELRPCWRIDYLKAIRKFAGDKFFSILVNLETAKQMYNIERKLLIYADFGTDGNEAIIKNLFLQTETCGKILIWLTDKPPTQAIKDIANYTSSLGGCGYGLNLINNIDDSNLHLLDEYQKIMNELICVKDSWYTSFAKVLLKERYNL